MFKYLRHRNDKLIGSKAEKYQYFINIKNQ